VATWGCRGTGSRGLSHWGQRSSGAIAAPHGGTRQDLLPLSLGAALIEAITAPLMVVLISWCLCVSPSGTRSVASSPVARSARADYSCGSRTSSRS
jgi:hypothetical protein